MPQFKCFLCQGQPTFSVKEGQDAWEQSHKHYMTYHFKKPEVIKQ